MNPLYMIPVIGSRGVYEFAAPFDTIAVQGVEYTCQGVRRISDYIATNEDVKDFVYKRYNLEDTVYDEDKANDAYIVSLQSGKGHWLYVPYRYIRNFPTGDGIQYCTRMIVFSLPSMPITQDLTGLVSEMKDRMTASLGIEVGSKEVEASRVVLVTKEVHDQKTLERHLRKRGSGLLQQVTFLETENASLRQRLKALEDHLIAIS